MSGSRSNEGPSCATSGFVALDVVLSEKNASDALWAGGSCGNVSALLAYLGWRTTLVARIGSDPAGAVVRDDLLSAGVEWKHVSEDARVRTPVVVQRIRQRSGQVSHTFSCACPKCGSWLPRYRAILKNDAERALAEISNQDFFYFDRAAPGTIDLAEALRGRGALVLFEPSTIGEPRLFRRAAASADIIKFSSERLGPSRDLDVIREVPLQIETLGSDGIRYRRKSEKDWAMLPAYEITDLRDSAGAGDWCSVGVMMALSTGPREPLESMADDSTRIVIEYGQAMAALACTFEGARGAMYAMKPADILSAVESIARGQRYQPDEASMPEWIGRAMNDFCPHCAE